VLKGTQQELERGDKATEIKEHLFPEMLELLQ
jgi:hypothetical protein